MSTPTYVPPNAVPYNGKPVKGSEKGRLRPVVVFFGAHVFGMT